MNWIVTSAQSNRSHAMEEEAETLPSPEEAAWYIWSLSALWCRSKITAMSTSLTFIPCVRWNNQAASSSEETTLVMLLTEEIDTQQSIGAKSEGLNVDRQIFI